MNPWVRRLLLAATGGGFVWAIVKVFSRRPEEDPDMDSTPLLDTAAPPFPSIMVESGKYLAYDAGQAFISMRGAAAQVGVLLPLSTAWRSTAWQQKLYDAYQAYQAFLNGTGPEAPWAPMAAKPGTSLHENGIAVDIAGVNPAASNYNPARAAWLKENAADFNFFNTGALFSSPEPWHYAYGVKREGINLLLA